NGHQTGRHRYRNRWPDSPQEHPLLLVAQLGRQRTRTTRHPTGQHAAVLQVRIQRPIQGVDPRERKVRHAHARQRRLLPVGSVAGRVGYARAALRWLTRAEGYGAPTTWLALDRL